MPHRQTPQPIIQQEKCSTLSILRDLSNTALGLQTDVLLTPVEAESLLNSLVGMEILKERIKKIQIERNNCCIEFTSQFSKYFEVMGHNGIIERICFDRGYKYVFTGGADGIIKCWSIPDGMAIKALYGHENPISDLCISKDGRLMVSVDYLGVLNIWCLEKFERLNSINLGSEAIFCEFVDDGVDGIGVCGKIFVVLANGSINCIKFNRSEVLEHKRNNFMLGESIKSICITDGGRMVICGGWWPFFLVYDTQDIERIIVLEEFKIQMLCAAKNSLKFATCGENKIFCYTFYCEGDPGMGNFIKRKGATDGGYWKKHVNDITEGESVDGLSFLPSFLLVAACSDGVIRIYEDDILVLSFSGEPGIVYSHPIENIFAVIGSRLTVYQIVDSSDNSNIFSSSRIRCKVFIGDSSESTSYQSKPIVNIIYSESIHVSINDCQFSDDGRFFVTCDDQGIMRAYSVYDPIEVPEEQFFISDIVPTASRDFNETMNFYRQNNENWRPVEYRITSVPSRNRCYKIEDVAIRTLDRLKLTEERFKIRYTTGIDGSETSESQDGQSDDETYIISDEESSSDESVTVLQQSDTSEDDSVTQSSENVGGKLRGFRRRLVDTESSGRRGRRFIVDESSDDDIERISEDEEDTSRQNRRSGIIVDGDASARRRLRRDLIVESGHHELRRTNRIGNAQLSDSGSPRIRRNSSFSNLQSSESPRPRRRASLDSRNAVRSIISDNDSPVIKRRRSESASMDANNTGGTSRRNKSVQKTNQPGEENEALEYSGELNESGINSEFEVILSNFAHNWIIGCSIYMNTAVFFNFTAYVEFMELEPRLAYSKSHPKKSGFFTVTSKQVKFIGKIPYLVIGLDSLYSIKLYEHPRSGGILCTTEQHNVKKGDSILYFDGDLIRGTVSSADQMKIKVNKTEILRSLIAVTHYSLGIGEIEYSSTLKILFGRSREHKFDQKPILNYSVINIKLSNNLYRSVIEFVEDLKYLVKIAAEIGDPLKNKAKEILRIYE